MTHHEERGGVVKVIELVGSSPNSFSDAVRNAVATASQTIRNIQGVDVISSNATVEGGRISNYKVNVKIAFLIERSAADLVGEGGASEADAEAM